LPEKIYSFRQRMLPGILSIAALGAAAFIPPAPACAATTSLVHDFNTYADGAQPYTKMVQAADGTFYGTTQNGGIYSTGTIFKITPAGEFQTLHSFANNPDGAIPYGSLLIGPDGNIYGTTIAGGAFGTGTVFKMTPDGTETVLYNFGSVANDGANPYAGLTYVAADGNLYGDTYSGGATGYGTIFKVSLAGAEQVIKSFSSSVGHPESTLCYNPSDGLLYGTADSTSGGNGGIFKGSTAGALTLVKNLNGATGYYPQNNGIVLAADGNLYGTLTYGGTNGGYGTIYRIVSGVFTTIHSFDSTEAYYPNSTLLVASDGALYGTSQNFGPAGSGNIFKVTTGASPVVTQLYSFTGSGDGSYPGPLMQAANGLLYGATLSGGALNYGSIYNITTTGSFFTVKDLNTGFHDGTQPRGRLLLGQDGNWYGTTFAGGLYSQGTIFEITAAGEYKILYNFGQIASVGVNPFGGLIQAPDGTFYGTATSGGSIGYGTVYKFTVSGSPQVATMSPVYAFDDTHGNYPKCTLLLASDGNLYGTTANGGPTEQGVIFKLTTAGVITVLRNFGGSNGAYPTSALIQGSDGALYGTTPNGGLGYGVLFKITTAGGGVWTKAVTATRAYYPQDALVFGSDGNLYGAANSGCLNGFGGIYQVTPTGTVTTVYSFDGTTIAYPQAPLLLGPDNKLYGSDISGALFRFDGANLDYFGTVNSALGTSIYASLAYGPDGNFYGAANQGGANNSGTVFQLDVDIPTITGFSPTTAETGNTIAITGTNFATATAVTINGASAAFTVVDDTHITATVPAAATPTGSIAVTTPALTATLGTFTVSPTTNFVVSAPSTATAGSAFNFTVTAKNSLGNTPAYYTGTVHFTSDDPNAILPADATLTNGTGTFSATLKTATHVTIRARDTIRTAITGTAAVDVAAIAATHLTIASPSSINSGAAFYVTVTAKDQYENVAKGYTGTLHFTSTDGQATLPADFTLTNGTKQVSVKLKTGGSQTVTATDTSNGALTVTTNSITVGVIASKLVVSAPSAATAGDALTVTVTAMDASGNTATAYTGTVHLTSTDAQALLPADATLTNGVGTFSVTLKTAASQTITATDTTTASIKGAKSGIVVSAAAASQLLISAPATATHNVAIYPVLTVKDAYGNLAKGYTGTLQITSTDPLAVYPATLTLTNGTKPLSIRFKTLGNQTFTATDTVNGALTATSPAILVN